MVTLACATVTKRVGYGWCTQNRLTFTITEIKNGSKIGSVSLTGIKTVPLIEILSGINRALEVGLCVCLCVFFTLLVTSVEEGSCAICKLFVCVCLSLSLFSAPCLSHGRWVATDDYVAVLGPSLPPTSTVVLKNMLSPGKTLSTEEEKKDKRNLCCIIFIPKHFDILRTFLICRHCSLCPG